MNWLDFDVMLVKFGYWRKVVCKIYNKCILFIIFGFIFGIYIVIIYFVKERLCFFILLYW